MNRDLSLRPPEGSWPIAPYEQGASVEGVPGTPSLDLPTIFRILRDWRWLILAAVAAGLVLAVVYTLVTTPMYRAWVVLQVNPPTVEILDERSGDRSMEAQTPWGYVTTQVGLLSSRSLAQRVAQDLNLANDANFVPQEGRAVERLSEATRKIQAGLKITAPDEGQLIRFNFEAADPQQSAAVANAIAEAFINSNLQRRYESSAYARNFLERQIAKTRTDLERSERQLVGYAQAQGIINTSSGDGANPMNSDANSPQGESLSEINRALSEATARRVAAEGAYRAALNSGITSVETESSRALRQARAALQAEYQQKRTQMKPDHPDMISIRSQVEELDRQIANENSNVAAGRVNALRADYQAASAAERALQARVSQLKSDVLNLRGRSIQYAILHRDVDTNRALYDALLQRYKEIGVAGGIGTAPVSIVDRADPPEAPFKPNLMLNLLVGLALGLAAGVVAAIVLEYLNDTIKDRDDVRNKLGLACLGIVPKRPAKGQFMEDLKDPTSGVSDAYSAVAASLSFSTETGTPKVLLLTSGRPAEGKSSSALALAQNYSRRGKSVLLVDCDLRKPAFKGPSAETGLTKLLTNSEPVSGHISPTYFDNLYLLPAGPIPPNPADLLSTGRLEAILREASTQFDMIIVDAPPVIGLADAPLIAAACKNVMFIIEAGKTRTNIARDALGKLQGAGAHILGSTLTKSAAGRATYGYRSGYGYGYGYGHKYGVGDKRRTEIALVADNLES